MIPFWGGFRFKKLPIASVSELHAYLKKNHVTYLILGDEVFSFRKEYAPILRGNHNDLFQKIKILKQGEKEFQVYRIM